jgi:hypothetical protein
MEESLDIVSVIKSVRKLEQLMKLLLTDSQIRMLPLMKSNVLGFVQHRERTVRSKEVEDPLKSFKDLAESKAILDIKLMQ